MWDRLEHKPFALIFAKIKAFVCTWSRVIREAFRANSSLYMDSQSMRATEEDETRCCGDAVPLLWLLAAPPGPLPLPPAAAGALATGFQWEQPGCGSGPFSSAVLLLLPLVPAPTFAAPALAAAEEDWGGAEEDWGGAEKDWGGAEEDWGGAEEDWGGAEEAWGEAGTAADVVPASPDTAESLLSVAWILKNTR